MLGQAENASQTSQKEEVELVNAVANASSSPAPASADAPPVAITQAKPATAIPSYTFEMD